MANGRLLSRRAHVAHDRFEKAFGSQHSPNRHVAHICGGGYSPRARLRLLFEFMQHMLFKFRCPHTLGTPFSRAHVPFTTDKQTGFSETAMQAFESFSVRQASRRKSFSVESPTSRAFPSATP
ncbi:hypothetical protein TNCV_3198231 [Trichonephila clavipes]|nr:hypothetical protein TNCV_3198231 [Trichonephila clavipes]